MMWEKSTGAGGRFGAGSGYQLIGCRPGVPLATSSASQWVGVCCSAFGVPGHPWGAGWSHPSWILYKQNNCKSCSGGSSEGVRVAFAPCPLSSTSFALSSCRPTAGFPLTFSDTHLGQELCVLGSPCALPWRPLVGDSPVLGSLGGSGSPWAAPPGRSPSYGAGTACGSPGQA